MSGLIDEIGALFDRPKSAEVDAAGAPLPGSTAWMDGARTPKDLAEQYMAYAQCNACGDWTFIDGKKENHGNLTRGVACTHCGAANFDPRSVISKRSFNPSTAKKRKPHGGKRKQ